MLSRRGFLKVAGLTVGGSVLHACAQNGGREVRQPHKQFWRQVDQQAWMDPGPLRPHWTQVSGLRMFALASVDAAPPDAARVVLVHGSGLSHRYMIPTARELTPHFRVYVPDMPGYGLSDDPGKVLDVPELADSLVAWMRAAGLERASFLGNSFGCQVIADLAARHPRYVEKVVLQGATTPATERSGFWQFVRWRQNQRYNPDWGGEDTRTDYRRAGLWRLIRSFQFQITDRIEDKVPHIAAPVLVVTGEHDPITGPSWSEEIARLCPRGRLLVIPGVAHTLVLTAPGPLAEATRAFLHEDERAG